MEKVHETNPISQADRTGSALSKADLHHRAASFVPKGEPVKRMFTGGDGKSKLLIQIEGKMNDKLGVFEYIQDSFGRIVHQIFKPGRIPDGIIN